LYCFFFCIVVGVDFFDVDQRNLIQLTGRQPKSQWGQGATELKVKDDVETVDMDVSEDDDETHNKMSNTGMS